MGKLQKSPGFDQKVDDRLGHLMRRGADKLCARFFQVVLSNLPREDGHAHEAFLSTIEKSGLLGAVQGGSLQVVLSHFAGHRSGDRRAKRFATGTARGGKSRISFKARVGLPFVRKLEYGGIITVGDLAGRRGVKIDGIGVLYGRRSTKGRGVLRFRDASGYHLATQRVISSPFNFLRAGAAKAKASAKRFGFIPSN